MPPLPFPKTRDALVARLHDGGWLWLSRPGYERDLVEELEAAPKQDKRPFTVEALGVGVVRSSQRPRWGGTPIELAFARQGLPIDAVVDLGRDPYASGSSSAAGASGDGGEGDAFFDRQHTKGQERDEAEAKTLAQAIARAARPLVMGADAAKLQLAVQAFVPDSDALNPLAPFASLVEQAIAPALLATDAERARLVPPDDAPSGKDRFLQVCVLGRRLAVVGAMPIAQAVSTARGGRRRIGAPKDSPSRAAAKLLEAFDWIGRAPEADDVCVDLGAAPGGWSIVLLDRRAKVIAVDPARLAPDVARRKGLTHVRKSAFEFALDEPVDWLFCDMAWRPLEVAALLAKWGRRRGARFLVANIKLPMKKKVEYLRRVREILTDGGWQALKVRQLYHDRDEVTVAGWHLG